MTRFWDKALKSSLAMLVVFSTLCLVSPSINVEAKATEYEIYPTPHDMTYQDKDFIIRSEVNVVFEDGIDSATKKRMNEVLESKNKQVSTSNQKVDGKTNILVGTYKSGGYVDSYVKSSYNVDESLFSKYGAHFVASNNGEIVILGSNSDGAFYGITSLKHIFNQMDGSTIRNFEIKDYADTDIRGFIEGYYGIPWSNEDRMSLMKFGGDFKMTSYVFAPKDDLYHKDLWRELYPEAELAAIKEMVQVGIDTKCRFVWTAHPFMGGFDASRLDEEIAALLNKFDQLYEVGVRQFGVLGDDVGSLDRSVVIKMMEEVSKWAKDKGDVYDSLFCPAGYNHAWQDDNTGQFYGELSDYDIGFPDDIKIFWTGEAVCQPVEQKTLDHFMQYKLPEGASERRSPLFWLNWPVNDINGGRLMMGKGSLLHTDINIEDLSGVVTNPMQEAEASKVAIFAVADYSWNVKDFDDDQSWVDSFKYIDKEASEELHILAKHMSNPEPNGHGLVLAESEELQPLINEFKTKLNNGESVIEIGKLLINEMDIIINACDGVHANSKNEKLKADLLPFTNSLKDLTTAIKGFVEAKISIEENDMASAYNYFSNASSKLIRSQNSVRVQINDTIMVSPGSTHLIPLAQVLQEKLAGPINEYVAGGEAEQPLVISASSSFTSWFSGKIEDIIDGNNDTAAWYGGYEGVGQYFQVDFSKPTTIYGIHILNGTKEKIDDTFGYAKLQYSTNGIDFKDLNKEIYGEYTSQVDVTNIEFENVVAVRYVCSQVGSGNKWPAMREFTVSTVPDQQEEFTKELIRTSADEGWSVYSGKDDNAIDGNRDTAVSYAVRWGGEPNNTMIVGDYIGVKLSKPITLGKINLLQGENDSTNDYIKNAQLQYSVDGSEWISLGDVYKETRNIVTDLSDRNIVAQYVRIVNTAEQGNWFGIREFDVAAKVYHNGKVFTNVGEYNSLTADYFNDNANITPVENITLAKGEYIGLRLDRIHELKSIVSDLSNKDVTIQISKNNYEWQDVKAGSLSDNARYIRIINNTDGQITLNVNEFVVNTNEVTGKSVAGSNFGIENPLNVFDGDWTSATAYQGSQNKGMYFVYDLGQEIDMDSFKAVCRDSEWDFPRHGKFSVSTDGENWNEIMTLGNQDEENPGETENTDEIGFVLPEHEISYNTKKVENLNVKARYLKFEITRTKVGADKWVRFQELEINNGEYMPSENNPTYTSNTQETRDGLFRYMNDGDIATMFIPRDTNSFVNYALSSNNEVNAIKIIQNTSVISNAVVKARVLSNTKGDQWITLGTLSQAINEFVLAKDTVLLDVKVEWKDVIPNIIELSTYSTQIKAVNTDVLKGLIDVKENTSAWTISSADVYNAAYEAGKAVLSSEYVSQTTVDNAVQAINNAIKDKLLKGDISKLEAVIDSALTDQNSYTASTWVIYDKAINAIKKAIGNADNTSVDDVTALIEAVNNAKASLVFNPSSKEEATIVIEAENDFVASIIDPSTVYTVNSWKEYTDAKLAVEKLLANNETNPVHPNDFTKATNELNNAKTKLVTVGNLPTLIKEFDEITDPSIYTNETFEAYKTTIEAGRKLLINGSLDDINKAIEKIETAKTELKINSITSDEVRVLVNELKALNSESYTKSSYEVLVAVITKVEAVDLDKATVGELSSYIEELNNAKGQLVVVDGLVNILAVANKVEPSLYTASSYKVLTDAIAVANQQLVDGDVTSIANSIKAVDEAIKALVIKANSDEVTDYINGIVSVDLSKYTDESVKKYQKAYDALKAMLDNLDNLSAKDFSQAKIDFEDAVAKLEEKATVTPVPTPNPDPEQTPSNGGDSAKTGDETNITIYIAGLIIVTLVGGYFFIKKRNIN